MCWNSIIAYLFYLFTYPHTWRRTNLFILFCFQRCHMLRCCKIYRCSQKLPLCNIKSRTLCQWVYQCQVCGTWTTVRCDWRVSAVASWLPSNVRTSRVWPTTYGIQHTLLGQSAIHRSHPGAETSIKSHNPSIKIWITSLHRSAVFCCCTIKCCCLGVY